MNPTDTVLVLFVSVALAALVTRVYARFTSWRRAVAVRKTATKLLASWSTGNAGAIDPVMVAGAFMQAELIVANEGVASETQLERAACGSEAEYQRRLAETYASASAPVEYPKE